MRLIQRFPAFGRALLAMVVGLSALTACNPSSASKPAAAPAVLPDNAESIVFGMGCFWGAEKRMSALPGVLNVVSGYAGGDYDNPDY